jgi:23S rRNA pseudouridine1911/1915/1917 synthase
VRVDRALADLLPNVSRASIQRWIAEGRVRVDGAPCRNKDKVRSGARIDFEPAPEPPTRAEPDANVQFGVVFEDEHLLVVDKPAGLVVHPGKGNRSGTLVNGLLARPGFERMVPDERDAQGFLRPGIVHRIDKDTSGLLVVAKTVAAREGLKALFARHDILRAYWALTYGVPVAGTIRTLHGRHPDQRLKFTTKVRDGKPAVTHVVVLERFKELAALVRCELDTGRTHQIRVHLTEHCATPLLCDRVYGRSLRGSVLAELCAGLNRQALHAGLLGFVHPITGESLRFEAPLPADFQSALDALRAFAASG